MSRVVGIDRRFERVTEGVAAIAHALRDDTALTLAGQRELGAKLEQSMHALARAVDQFAIAVRRLATARILATPDPDAPEPAPQAWLERPVGDLPGLAPRLVWRLDDANIRTVGELIARADHLPKLRNVGAKAMQAICVAVLAALRDGPPPDA
jgi:hypothetical protein